MATEIIIDCSTGKITEKDFVLPDAHVLTKEQRLDALNKEYFDMSQKLKAAYATAYLGVILTHSDGTAKTQAEIDSEVNAVKTNIKTMYDKLRDEVLVKQEVILNG